MRAADASAGFRWTIHREINGGWFPGICVSIPTPMKLPRLSREGMSFVESEEECFSITECFNLTIDFAPQSTYSDQLDQLLLVPHFLRLGCN